MSPETAKRAEATFQAALDRPSADRDAFIEARCGDDAELRRAVEALLVHHDDARSRFLDQPATLAATTADPRRDTAPLPPDSFPAYQLLKEVHRGGQGVVYQAIQKSTQRKVAVKVMREGPFAGPADRARFEREIQVLGQLNHPNIVTIHDSGSAAGCDYFVMDYISGQPLDAFVADGRDDVVAARPRPGDPRGGRAARRFSVEGALRLFVKVCSAVNAAHLRGIIHRDLKPGNIRVDGEGEPHILDFGLAKVAAPLAAAFPLERHGEAVGALTMTGQFIGSVPWASPEQAEGSPDRVDVRTDVYSLGVILYQMLTGRFPYEVTGNMRDVLDRIVNAEPLRPRLASAAGRRLNDEVETIVLKCLAKERERRYQSAGELARDVQRYLTGEPIEAKRDSVGYVLHKYLRRYRIHAAIAAAFAVVIVAGLFISLALWRQSARAEVEQRRLAAIAWQASREADARRTEAEEARRRSVAAVKRERAMFGLILGVIQGTSPNGKGPPPKTIAELLDRIGAAVDSGRFAESQDVEHMLRYTLGVVLKERGAWEAAKTHLVRALALSDDLFSPASAAGIQTRTALGEVALSQGGLPEADRMFCEAFNGALAHYTERDPQLLAVMQNFAAVRATEHAWLEAEALYRQVLAVRRAEVPQNAQETGYVLHGLATLLHQTARFEEAEPLHREALLLREGEPATLEWATTATALAHVLIWRGALLEAQERLGDALDRQRERLAPNHPAIATTWQELARVHCRMGLGVRAEAEARQCLRIYEGAHFESNSVPVLIAGSVIGECLALQGCMEAAEPLLTGTAELLLASPDASPTRQIEAIDRVISLYRSCNRPPAERAWLARRSAILRELSSALLENGNRPGLASN